MVVMALGAGCTDAPPPSCQEALTHYYSVGCFFENLSVTPARPYTVNEAIVSCKEVNVAVPDRCRSYFDDFNSCLVGATSTSCKICASEQDRLFGCK